MEAVRNYVGTNLIKAWFEEKGGNPGYHVVCDDSYQSWIPKDVFNRCYRQVTDNEVKFIEEEYLG